MFHRVTLACLASCWFGNPIALFAQDSAVSIQILATVDYPGGSGATFPAKMNDRGDIAGGFLDSSGSQRGFVRFRNGSFSPPIVPPFEVGRFTQSSDINNARAICGVFSDPTDTIFHGYLMANGTFAQFDIEGAVATYVSGLNNSGDFVGSFVLDTGEALAFVDLAGTVEPFSIPSASFTSATSINNAGEIIGSYRIGTEKINHGFIRDPAGNLTFPIDFPGPLGASGTIVQALNDRGWIVGTYFNLIGKERGFLFRSAHGFLAFDYPGALATSLTGINDTGLICGSYIDPLLLQRRGFIARIVRRSESRTDRREP